MAPLGVSQSTRLPVFGGTHLRKDVHVAIFVLAAALSACTGRVGDTRVNSSAPATTSSTSSTVVAAAGDDHHERIDAERAAWDALAIDDYVIRYERSSHDGMADADEGFYDVTVIDGNVVECQFQRREHPDGIDCMGSVLFNPVLTLFTQADNLDPSIATVQFHRVWHIPESIRVDVADTIDEEYTIRVLFLRPIGEGYVEARARRQTWARSGIASYAFILRSSAYACLLIDDGPIEISVVGNRVASVVTPTGSWRRQRDGSWARSGDIQIGDPETVDVFTIDGLLARIERGLLPSLLPAGIGDVRYDELTGHPISVTFRGDDPGCEAFTVEVLSLVAE